MPGDRTATRQCEHRAAQAGCRSTDGHAPTTCRYLTSTEAPASSSLALAASAASLLAFSRTGFGAPSTRSLASLRPRLVSSRTALMTWIFWAPAPVEDDVELVLLLDLGGGRAAAGRGGRATATGAAAVDAELLLERVEELLQLEHRECADRVEDLFLGGHVVCLVLLNGGAGVFELGLGGLGGVLVGLLEDGLGRAVDEVLGLLQAQAGQLAHGLDDLDLLGAGAGEDDVELVLLLLGRGGGAATGGGRRRRRRRGRRRSRRSAPRTRRAAPSARARSGRRSNRGSLPWLPCSVFLACDVASVGRVTGSGRVGGLLVDEGRRP